MCNKYILKYLIHPLLIEIAFIGQESRLSPNITTIERTRFQRQALESRRPHFANIFNDYSVSHGGTIGLQAEIRGAPTRVEWLREGRAITEINNNAKTFVDHDIYTLSLSDVTEREAGTYTCRAWSSHGKVDMDAAVTVVGPSDLKEGKPAVIVGRPDKTILISVGEDLNISFRVHGEPKPKGRDRFDASKLIRCMYFNLLLFLQYI